jgi:hypothetical protein
VLEGCRSWDCDVLGRALHRLLPSSPVASDDLRNPRSSGGTRSSGVTREDEGRRPPRRRIGGGAATNRDGWICELEG